MCRSTLRAQKKSTGRKRLNQLLEELSQHKIQRMSWNNYTTSWNQVLRSHFCINSAQDSWTPSGDCAIARTLSGITLLNQCRIASYPLNCLLKLGITDFLPSQLFDASMFTFESQITLCLVWQDVARWGHSLDPGPFLLTNLGAKLRLTLAGTLANHTFLLRFIWQNSWWLT